MQDKGKRRTALARVLGLRKRPRKALRQMERQLNEAEKLARAGSWSWRSDSIVWSAGMYTIFGVDPEAALSIRLFTDSVHPEDRAFVQAVLSTIAAGPRRRELECRIVRTDGAVRTIAAIADIRFDTGRSSAPAPAPPRWFAAC